MVLLLVGAAINAGLFYKVRIGQDRLGRSYIVIMIISLIFIMFFDFVISLVVYLMVKVKGVKNMNNCCGRIMLGFYGVDRLRSMVL